MTESAEYTPTLEDLRAVWVSHRAFNNYERSFGKFWEVKADAEFDRWLEAVRAEAKAEVLNEVADEWERLVKIGKQLFTETTREDRAAFDDWAGQEKPGWLRARANQYKENQS